MRRHTLCGWFLVRSGRADGAVDGGGTNGMTCVVIFVLWHGTITCLETIEKRSFFSLFQPRVIVCQNGRSCSVAYGLEQQCGEGLDIRPAVCVGYAAGVCLFHTFRFRMKTGGETRVRPTVLARTCPANPTSSLTLFQTLPTPDRADLPPPPPPCFRSYKPEGSTSAWTSAC